MLSDELIISEREAPPKPFLHMHGEVLDITFFVACRNERGNVGRALRELILTLRDYPLTYEIIVVDDGSSDGSPDEVNEIIREFPGIDITLKLNAAARGVSHNICDAAMIGRGQYFQYISGAFQNRRNALRSVFDQVGAADLILTYLSPDGRPWHRRVLSRTYTGLVNLVSGYRIRHYHGTPLFRRMDILRWHSYRRIGFYADMITHMLDQGITYIQVPTECHVREMGSSRALRLTNFLSLSIGFSSMLLRRMVRIRKPSTELPPRQV